MTKQLREWTAPDGGETYRWDPTVNYVQRKVGETWVCVFDATEILDHADALNSLRADPYVTPKGLREQIADALSNAYEAGRYGLGAPGWSGVSTIADAVVEMIDRERPALGEVDGEVLRDELVRRGYESREMAYFGFGAILHSGSKTEDPRKVYGVNSGSVRRVLIAPERAG